MAAGPSIAGYVDVRRIGRGGLGDVYSARQESTGRDVAIKVLRDVSDSSVAWHRTRRELTALLALSGHANVIQIVELLELDEGPALVMEYAPGGSVADLLEARGTTFDADETVFVGRQVAAALVAAHERGIVHRDIKPQNLLIDEGGQVKLCDFGIAAITRDDEYRNRTNAISMRYASPEDLEHDVEVGAPSDIYSLGATLLHLVHGAPPTLKERLAPWDPPFVDDPRVAAVDRVIARCLHPNPSVRPTARAVLESFDGLAAGSGDDRVTALPLVPRRPASPGPADTTHDPAPAADPPTAELAGLLGRAGAPPDAVRPAPSDMDVGHDETLAAPAGTPLVRPRPDDRRVGRLAVGVGAVLVVLIGVLVIWPADADAPTSTRSASAGPVTASGPPDSSTVPAPTASIGAVPLATLPRPEGLPPLESADWTAGDVGDCLVQLDGVEALAVVHCDEPHDLQRVTVGALDELERLAELDEYDQDLIRAAVTDACAQQFVGFVGNDVVDSELALVTAQPSGASWADGDRNYGCYVGRNGYRITGDASNSGW